MDGTLVIAMASKSLNGTTEVYYGSHLLPLAAPIIATLFQAVCRHVTKDKYFGVFMGWVLYFRLKYLGGKIGEVLA